MCFEMKVGIVLLNTLPIVVVFLSAHITQAQL